MNKTLLAFAVLSMTLASTSAIYAHHSIANFNTDTSVTIRGTLRRVEIVAPHSLLYVEQTTPDGPVLWAVEGPAPNGLARRGFRRDEFDEGDNFEACGYTLKGPVVNPSDGSRRLVAEVLVMPDGSAHLWSPYGQELCQAQGVYTIVP